MIEKILSAPGSAADWAAVLVGLANAAVGIWIAVSVSRLTRTTEKNQSLQTIYEQWMRKKELSIQVPAISELDAAMYSPDGAYTLKSQQQRVWLVLIIDILFNCYLAAKDGLYPQDVYEEDMEAHLGSMLRFDSAMVDALMRERGYCGKGVVGEFYEEVQRIKQRIEARNAAPPAQP